jgi:hypothetical protein
LRQEAWIQTFSHSARSQYVSWMKIIPDSETTFGFKLCLTTKRPTHRGMWKSNTCPPR